MKNILVFIPFLCGVALQAQEVQKDSVINLSDVTIIGDRIKKIPGAGEYITPKELAKLNQPDINKVLRIVPGVNVRDEEGFGLRPNIGLRGTPVNRSAKITLMEDGVLIAPAPYADPSAYYFPTFARMEGVEVLKGSSQIKNGPYTIGGAVNLLSTSIPDSFKAFAQASYGTFDTNQQRIWVGDSKQNFDYLFEVNRFASNGFKDLDNGGNTGFDRRDVVGKLRWHTDADAKVFQSVTLKFVNTTEDGNESYLGLTYEDFKANPNRRYAATQKDKLIINHQHLSLNHIIKPLKNLNISTTGYYSNTFRDWGRVNSVGGQTVTNIVSNPTTHATPYQIMIGKADGSIVYQGAARTFTVKGVQSNAKYDFETGKVKHSLQTGVRVHEDQADRYATQSTYAMTNGRMILSTAGIQGNNENQIRKASAVAGYFQYDINYKGLTIAPGVRYESVKFDFQNYFNADFARIGTALKTAQNEVNILLPGIGVNYEINSKMSSFAGVHKGFSPPGMPAVDNQVQAKVETAVNYELGYRFHVSGFKTQVVGFLNNYDNILGSDNVSSGGLGTGNMYNAGRAKVQGVELSADYNLMTAINSQSSLRLPISIAYTYTEATFQDTFKNAGGDWGTGVINKGDLIPFITPHLLTQSIGIESNKFSFTIISRFVGETRTKPGQGDVITPGDNVNYNDVNTIGNYWVVDFSGNYKFYKNVSAFTIINNVFDNKYIVANLPQGYRPGMPFAVNLGLKVEIK